MIAPAMAVREMTDEPFATRLDAVLLGKGPSAGTFDWGRILSVVPIVAINEAIVLVPAAWNAPVLCVAQDADPVRRIAMAANAGRVPRVPDVAHFASDHRCTYDAEKMLPGWKIQWFRLCDVPRGATACIAVSILRATAAPGPLYVGCVGFDAYFAPKATFPGSVYAPRIERATGEVQNRSADYSRVNGQIADAAARYGCVLFDLTAHPPLA